MTVRTALEYNREENKMELGEYAIEYLKRISQLFRIVTLVEGSQDEVELIIDNQLHVSSNIIIKLNAGIGLTSKATDFTPEVGVMFAFRFK
jgi:hypothetical protein